MTGLSRRFFLAATCAAAALRPYHVAAAEDLDFSELYSRGTELSDKATALTGERVRIEGYMAPPLKPEADFFVMTKMPMAVCPFCDNEADWPRDILFVRMERRQPFVPFNRRIVVEGVLEAGTETDPETGFVSRVRLTDASFERA